MPKTPLTILDHALDLNQRGLATFPIAAGTKDKPQVRFTLEATKDEAKNREWFEGQEHNIGVSTTGYLVVDLDAKHDGVENFKRLFNSGNGHEAPHTLVVRTPGGGLHVIYRLPEGVEVANRVSYFGPRFIDAGIAVELDKNGDPLTGIDIRGYHGYIVGAGSRIGKKRYKIEIDAPITLAPLWLIDACEAPPPPRAAGGTEQIVTDPVLAEKRAAAWLGEQLPAPDGKRNDLGYKAACLCRDFGCAQAQTEALLTEHFRADPPLDATEIARVCRSAFRYAQNTPGCLTPEAMGFNPVEDGSEPRARVPVKWDEGRVHEVRPAVESVIQSDTGRPIVLQRGPDLVTVAYGEQAGVVRDQGKAPLRVPLAVPYTFSTIKERVASSVRLYKSLHDGKTRDIACPDLLARLLLESQPKSAPVLGAILDTPLVKLDGSLIESEGYDPATRAYGAFHGRDFLPVPESPTRTEAEAAYRVLVDEGFADVPFDSPTDAAVKVAMLLTLIQRPMLSEAPGLYTSAPAGGTGKTTSDIIVAYVATGEFVAPTSWPGADEYQSSTLLHDLARQGARVVLFDNLPDGASVSGASLETVMTSGSLKRRTVGSAESASYPFQGTILLNGNNLQFDSEGVRRRFLHCELNARCEKPAERQFSRPDLRGWLCDNRNRMLQAALTMLRAARLAGVEPSYTLGFPIWARYVIAALEYAGAPSIVGKLACDSVENSSDNALVALTCSWQEAFGKRFVVLREALEWVDSPFDGTDASEAEKRKNLRAAFVEFMGDHKWDGRNPLVLARKLRTIKGRVARGRWFNSLVDRNGITEWRVEGAANPGASAVSETVSVFD